MNTAYTLMNSWVHRSKSKLYILSVENDGDDTYFVRFTSTEKDQRSGDGLREVARFTSREAAEDLMNRIAILIVEVVQQEELSTQ